MMKRILSLLLLACLALGLLTGCQKTPETVIVIGKDQEQMLETAEHGKDNSALLTALEVPERFTGDWTGVNDLVHVTADAEIALPNADKIPTGSIARRDFTQEDADTLMRVFLKGNTLYEEQGLTKQQALERLERYQAMQRGEIPLEGDVTYETLPETIERWAEYARTAPNEGERFLASTSFVLGDVREEIEGCAEVDGKLIHLYIYNHPQFWDKAIYYVDGYGDVNSSNAQLISYIPEGFLDAPLTVDFPLEDAIKLGDSLIAELGFEHVVCDNTSEIYFVEHPYDISYVQEDGSPNTELDLGSMITDTGYELQYVRCLDDFPISYTPIEGSAVPEGEAFVGIWTYEYITLDITKDGLVYFCWSSPHTEPELKVEDTQLMPFRDVSDIFGKMIMVKNSDLQRANEVNGFTTTRSFHIDRVKLGLMRIKAKDSLDEGLLVPVWDFWGTETWEYNGHSNSTEETIILTVNAIDGSMIDREIGY